MPKDWWKSFFKPAFYTPASEAAVAHAPLEVRFVQKVLRLKRRARVLDVCCGPGRHSLLLSAKGCRVTGLDYSLPYLRQARASARRRRLDARFVRGDMKAMRFCDEFDVVLNLFTSFGYFSKQSDNLRVLQGVRRALKPGGLFLIDVMDRESLLRRFQSRDWAELGRGVIKLEERRKLSRARRLRNRWIKLFPDGRRMEHRFDLHLYDKRTLGRLLRKAGLRPLRFWGSFTGKPLSRDTNRLIVLSQKPR